jgi:hypothetical protein
MESEESMALEAVVKQPVETQKTEKISAYSSDVLNVYLHQTVRATNSFGF